MTPVVQVPIHPCVASLPPTTPNWIRHDRLPRPGEGAAAQAARYGGAHGGNVLQSSASAVGSAAHVSNGAGSGPATAKRCPRILMASAMSSAPSSKSHAKLSRNFQIRSGLAFPLSRGGQDSLPIVPSWDLLGPSGSLPLLRQQTTGRASSPLATRAETGPLPTLGYPHAGGRHDMTNEQWPWLPPFR